VRSDAASAPVPIARPLFLAGHERPLFAWHHAPAANLRRGAGVVLCPPLGYEYMSSYQTLRMLAERLAALGFDTVRLDYDGTGNSAGRYEDAGRVDAWLRSITCALAETRQLAGNGEVALVGLRAGALLALQAAVENGGVDGLVLWSPFSSGRAYIREVKAISGLTREDFAGEDLDEPGVNAAGHWLSEDAVAALERWTLDTLVVRPAAEILLVDRDDRPAERKLADRLEALGAQVRTIRPAGTSTMLVRPHAAQVPEQVLDEITTWFRRWGRPSPPGESSPLGAGREAAVAVVGDCQERTVRFGPDDRLFGVLTSPFDEHADAPTVILLNTGVEYHVGPHRLYVPLAREWAACGHLVLRFDLGGIGDSAPPAGTAHNLAYPRHMLDDAREAIAFVRREAPRRGVILAGLCSGGWLAFQAAREGLEVDAIVSINPPLYLRDGSAGIQWTMDVDEIERYQRSLRDPMKWMKALRGAASYRALVKVAARSMTRHVSVRVSGVLGDGLASGLARDLVAIAGRGIRPLFVFSQGDDGLAYFQLHGAPALRQAGVRDLIQHVVVEGAGHTFRPRAAQRALGELLAAFVAAESVNSVVDI
jgi:alpha-beta hydrolase superfamily lysophospholipase